MTNLDFARKVLRLDVLTPEDIIAAHKSVVYSGAQVRALKQSAPNRKVTNWARKNGFLLLPYPPKPMSLSRLKRLSPELFEEPFIRKLWWEFQTQEIMPDNGWLMIRKIPIPTSFKKTFNSQAKTVPQGERLPTAAELAWAMINFYLVRGVRFLDKHFVRPSSVHMNLEHPAGHPLVGWVGDNNKGKKIYINGGNMIFPGAWNVHVYIDTYKLFDLGIVTVKLQ